MITTEFSQYQPRLTYAWIVLLMMVGCSFEASKLRGPAARGDASTPNGVVDSRAEAWDNGGLDLALTPEAGWPVDPPQSDALVLKDVNPVPDVARDLPQSDDSRPDITDGPGHSEDAGADAEEMDAATDAEAAMDAEPPVDVEPPGLDTPTVSGNDGAEAPNDDTEAPIDAGLDAPMMAETGDSHADSGWTEDDAGEDALAPDSGPANVIKEYKLPTGFTQPWCLTAGPQDTKTLWIAGHTTGKILKYSIDDNTFTEFQAFPSASGIQIEGIVWGPDDNLWLTEYNADKIARMTPSGEVSEYSVTRYSGPDGIVVGQDGKLWFTEMSGNRIGSISVDGDVSEYPVNITNSYPARLTVTADGNIWFTQYNSGRIGRLVPSAPTPTVSWLTSSAYSAPSGIAAGADGNLWFIETAFNRIGRMTTAGVVDGFPISTQSSSSTRGMITLGPDNNMWFTEYAANKIGRITPTGSITEFPTPGKTSGPMFIIAGPDGKIWFTLADSNKLASISL